MKFSFKNRWSLHFKNLKKTKKAPITQFLNKFLIKALKFLIVWVGKFVNFWFSEFKKFQKTPT